MEQNDKLQELIAKLKTKRNTNKNYYLSYSKKYVDFGKQEYRRMAISYSAKVEAIDECLLLVEKIYFGLSSNSNSSQPT